MNPQAWFALVGLVLALQGATLAYVVRIEARLTRLEVIDELNKARAGAEARR